MKKYFHFFIKIQFYYSRGFRMKKIRMYTLPRIKNKVSKLKKTPGLTYVPMCTMHTDFIIFTK